jgi:hypothetical protein
VTDRGHDLIRGVELVDESMGGGRGREVEHCYHVACQRFEFLL